MSTSRRRFLAASLGMTGASLLMRNITAAPAKKFSSWDPQARALLGRLSLQEKIGQMTQPDISYIKDPDDVAKYHLGSILSGGDSDPKSGNDVKSWTDMYEDYQRRAVKASPRIPLLYGIDSVHGMSNLLGAVIFPHNIGLGCTRNADLVEKFSRILAEETRATGINWAFAPCVAAPQDIRWGRTYEGFSESPDIVKVLGAAAVRGIQGPSLDGPNSVLACSKHYAGDGGTLVGTGIGMGPRTAQHLSLDQGDTRLSDADFRRIHLQGYITTVAEGVGTVMPSYSSWNGVKCSGNYILLTEILKQEMGFEGFLISDYRALNELPGNYKQQIEMSINAGMDMVMVPDAYQQFMKLLEENVNERRVPMSRIDDAVLRILRVKYAMGLLDPKTNVMSSPSLLKTFGSAEHRAIARQCVRESLTLLKNDRSALPLKRDAKIHVAGKSADNIGNQCGGWTITWQGKSGDVTTGGTTILAAMKKVANQVTYSRDGSGAEGASVGVAIIGETPYAEGMGDRTDLRVAAEDIAVVDNLKRAGIPVVAVIVSGRPLQIDELIGRADAIIAAWLPGTEGDGVADVLFGEHRVSGKSSFTWPSTEAKSLHIGDPGYKALFPLGHGLSY